MSKRRPARLFVIARNAPAPNAGNDSVSPLAGAPAGSQFPAVLQLPLRLPFHDLGAACKSGVRAVSTTATSCSSERRTPAHNGMDRVVEGIRWMGGGLTLINAWSWNA